MPLTPSSPRLRGMLPAVLRSLEQFSKREKTVWYLLLVGRSLTAILDVAAIMLVGYMAALLASFGGSGNSLSLGADSILVLPKIEFSVYPVIAMSILVLFLSKSLISFLLARKSALLVAVVEARVAKKLAEQLFLEDLTVVRSQSREDINFALQMGSPSAFNGLLNSANVIVAEATLFAAICFGFFLASPSLTVLAILYFGMVAAIIHLLVGRRVRIYGGSSVKSSVGVNVELNNLYSVYKELFVLGRTRDYLDRLGRARLEAAKSAAAKIYLRGIPRYVIEASLLIGITAILIYQLIVGDLIDSAASLGIFLAGGFRLTGALIPLQAALLDVKYSLPRANQTMKILRDGSMREAVGDKNQLRTPISNGAIGVSVQDVTFTHSDTEVPTIKGVSFEIGEGEQVALVGPSGAGKSTLADLLAGLLVPSSGTISYASGGASLKPEDLRGEIGYVPQRPGLVAGSILSNITLSFDSDENNMEWAKTCLKEVGLLDLIEALPDGVISDIGNLFDSLSGGQLQRLGLARALYFRPRLLILDEATSSLDAESESGIVATINNLRGKVTTVLIAHRLNSIQFVDRTFFVDGGLIVDSGKLSEVAKRNPAVERMIKLLSIV
jgi:ATP-binding cassette, subfamily B, bacterial PglK